MDEPRGGATIKKVSFFFVLKNFIFFVDNKFLLRVLKNFHL